MAGGTGGHIIPAITIGLSLASFEKTFVCGERDIESTIYRSFSIEPVKLSLGSFFVAKYLLLFPKNLLKSILLIRRANPSSVLVAGNYTSGPMGIAAFIMNKKLLAIEQDALIGKANRIFARFAYRIFTAYRPPFRHIDNRKAVFIGHVIRRDVRTPSHSENDVKIKTDKKIVLILGGSQGALVMTRKAVEALLADGRYHIVAVAGKNSKLFTQTENLTVLPYYSNIGYLYSLADIIIARSGALSVAEIASTNKPALFVPLPSASNDEQRKNLSSVMKKNRQFGIIDERDITKESLMKKLAAIEGLRGSNMPAEREFEMQIRTIENYV